MISRLSLTFSIFAGVKRVIPIFSKFFREEDETTPQFENYAKPFRKKQEQQQIFQY